MHTTRMQVLCAAIIALGLAACDRDDGAYADATPEVVPPATAPEDSGLPAAGTDAMPATATPGMLTVANAGMGDPYLVDAAGNALYLLEGDTDGSRCTGACLEAWPPLLVTDVQPSTDASLRADLVGTIQRPDGSTQVTYNGRPLHRYAADTGAGRAAGHDLEDQWGEWYLVSPEGEALADDALEDDATEDAAEQAPEDAPDYAG